MGDYIGDYYGCYTWDTRSLDYSSYVGSIQGDYGAVD